MVEEHNKKTAPSPTGPATEEDTKKAPLKKKPIQYWLRRSLSVLATLVILVAVYALLPISTQNTPQTATDAAWVALQKQDLTSFKKVVNISSFVQSLIEQAFVYEQALQNNPNKTFNSGIGNALKADLNTAYTTQIEALVTEGAPQNHAGLLAKLWQETGALKHFFVTDKVIDAHENYALVDLIFKRTDLNNTKLHLNLLLEKGQANTWSITGAPNLAAFLTQIHQIRQNKLALRNAPIYKEIANTISVIDIQKAAGLTPTQTQKPGVLWRIAYLSNSLEEISNLTLKLKVYNNDNTLLKEVTIPVEVALLPGSTAEIAWPMALNVNNLNDIQILNGDLKTLRTEVTTTAITFASGRILTPLTSLPIHTQPKQ